MNPPNPSKLIDKRTGIITSVVRQPRRPGEPAAFIAFGARIGSIGFVSKGTADPYAFGASFGDVKPAWWAAVGEAVERYCGNIISSTLEHASYNSLQESGCDAIDPATISLYSTLQYESVGFPFVPFTPELKMRWVQGEDLATRERVYVPASLVYLNPYRLSAGQDPPTNFMIYAGIAAGPTLTQAIQSALEELIERDAVTIWWHSGGQAMHLDISVFPLLDSYLTEPTLASLSFSLMRIPCSLDIPVVGVLLEDHERKIVAFGSACRPILEDAAIKAVTEAVQIRTFAWDLQDRSSSLWRAIDRGILPSHPYAAHRADRTYRDAFREDYRDMTDLAAQAQLWLDPRTHDQYLDRLRNVQRDRSAYVDRSQCPESNQLCSHIEKITQQGLRALAVNLTTPDVMAAGLYVARVVVPGMYGNAPPAFPFLGGERLYNVPYKLGLVSRPLRESNLVRHPLPYA